MSAAAAMTPRAAEHDTALKLMPDWVRRNYVSEVERVSAEIPRAIDQVRWARRNWRRYGLVAEARAQERLDDLRRRLDYCLRRLAEATSV